MAPDHESLRALLRRILARDEVRPHYQGLETDWDSAWWVSCRLAELLPLPTELKQVLLELDDAEQLLDVLHAVLEEQRVT